MFMLAIAVGGKSKQHHSFFVQFQGVQWKAVQEKPGDVMTGKPVRPVGATPCKGFPGVNSPFSGAGISTRTTFSLPVIWESWRRNTILENSFHPKKQFSPRLPSTCTGTTLQPACGVNCCRRLFSEQVRRKLWKWNTLYYYRWSWSPWPLVCPSH